MLREREIARGRERTADFTLARWRAEDRSRALASCSHTGFRVDDRSRGFRSFGAHFAVEREQKDTPAESAGRPDPHRVLKPIRFSLLPLRLLISLDHLPLPQISRIHIYAR